MNRLSGIVITCAAVTIAIAFAAIAVEPAKDANPAAAAAGQQQQQQPPLPPGWTEADMAAMMEAMTPGKMQEKLAKDVGTWHGKSTFWMHPGAEAAVSENTVTDKAVFDGRYIRSDWAGSVPGMGPFKGEGLKGYDNASKKFVSTWFDSMSTGIMYGTGELSADGNTIDWKFEYHCPVTKKPVVMRQIETWKGDDAKTLEMWGVDPKSGKEYKMMFIELTRKK